jgi:hypothetical protein
MSPQLNPAQLQKAITNGTKLVESKRLELSAYQTFREHAGGPFGERLLTEVIHDVSRMAGLQNAVKDFFASKVLRAEVELEELELAVKAYTYLQKQADSRIQVPGARMG